MKTIDTLSNLPVLPWPLVAADDAWRWFDAATAAAQAWLEFQQAMWQPLANAQAQWLCRCVEFNPMLPQLTVRGTEQLA